VLEKPVEKDAVSRLRILRSGKKWPLPSAMEAPNSENWTGHCIEKRSGLSYPLIAKPKWGFRSTGRGATS
jgi:hypothetical protein